MKIWKVKEIIQLIESEGWYLLRAQIQQTVF